jgi:AcrR family transcriptional regulator
MARPSQAASRLTGPRQPRRRRTAEQARHEILRVAASHLAAGGPDAIRLHAIAREMGVTHQAILRHFRTRDQLVASLLRHAGKRLRETLAAAVAAPEPTPASARTLYGAMDRVYRRRGYARLSARLVLAGGPLTGSGLYRDAADAIHRRRRRGWSGAARSPALEDTRFAVVLLSLVAWADALVGGAMRRAAALPDDELTAQRFRAWFTNLVEDHLLHRSRSGTRAAIGR